MMATAKMVSFLVPMDIDFVLTATPPLSSSSMVTVIVIISCFLKPVIYRYTGIEPMQRDVMPLYSEAPQSGDGDGHEWLSGQRDHLVHLVLDGPVRIMQRSTTLTESGLCFGFFGYSHFKVLPFDG